MLNYETFAKVYDTVMDSSLYEKWFQFVQRNVGSEKKNILELACGTGALAITLAKEGYQVTGLDLSEEMLSEAYGRAVQENVVIQWVQGDMRSLSQVGSYDVVTCFSDSICYMENEEQVQQVFDEVYQALENDGLFLFDVHSLYQIDEVFPNYSYHENEEDFAFLWDSFSGETPHSIVHELTFFVRENESSENFCRKDEVHKERTYPLASYQAMLENAGFISVQVFADFTQNSPDKETKRWFFVCRK